MAEKEYIDADQIKASDVAEVVHGKWTANDYCNMEWNGDYTIKHAFSCSCCNRIMYNDSKTDYCPHCGAKMDEKETKQNG